MQCDRRMWNVDPEQTHNKMHRLNTRQTNPQPMNSESHLEHSWALNFMKKQTLSYFGKYTKHWRNEYLKERWKANETGRPNRSWEKDVEDWMGASVWRVGRTAGHRLMYRRSIKAAMSRNGYLKERQCYMKCNVFTQLVALLISLSISEEFGHKTR